MSYLDIIEKVISILISYTKDVRIILERHDIINQIVYNINQKI